MLFLQDDKLDPSRNQKKKYNLKKKRVSHVTSVPPYTENLFSIEAIHYWVEHGIILWQTMLEESASCSVTNPV